MILLGIETSCDETAASVIRASSKKQPVEILSNIISTSLQLHAKTGGIIPETAAREQLKFIIPVIDKALVDAKIQPATLDAIAVTYGPGLIGSLLVGVETAKTLAYAWNKPLIGVNHLFGHLYANWIKTPTATAADRSHPALPQGGSDGVPAFPALGLVVSGGHTDLVLIHEHGDIKWLGGTRDDAAGEAFDKIGRLLGLPYPAGPFMEKLAKSGDHKAYNFPRPMADSGDLNFSFSGLKSAVSREITRCRSVGNKDSLDEQTVNNICASTQQAIVTILVKKTIQAAEKHRVKSILLGGGVAANQALVEKLHSSVSGLQSSIRLFVPAKNLCTDNAAMIAAAGFYNDQEASWEDLKPNPELYFD